MSAYRESLVTANSGDAPQPAVGDVPAYWNQVRKSLQAYPYPTCPRGDTDRASMPRAAP